MFPTDHHPPYTIVYTENTQYHILPPILSPSSLSLCSNGSDAGYAMVSLQEPTVPKPAHITAYTQRSKSVAGLLRPSPMEMELSRVAQSKTAEDVVREITMQDKAAELYQRPRSATGLAQYMGQNTW